MARTRNPVPANLPAEKDCAACGRRFRWRKKWAREWEAVRYCSDACRRSKGATPQDRALEQAILKLLNQRAPDATLCPSEAARAVGGADESDWRRLMEPARRAGRRLAAAGRVEFLQRGKAVDPATVRGPVRLRRGPRFAAATR